MTDEKYQAEAFKSAMKMCASVLKPRMQIAHIVPIANVLAGFRQPVEMYLAHKILQNPDEYAKLRQFSNSTFELGDRVMMVDNSAYELTYLQNRPPLEMAEVIEAAEVIGANEIVLRDWPGDGARSLQMTFESLNEVEKSGWRQPGRRVVAIVAGKTFEQWVEHFQILSGVSEIDVIGIPKYLASMGATPYMGRTEFMKLCGSKSGKAIHFFGCTFGLIELMGLPRWAAPRSMDTSWFVHNAERGYPVWKMRTEQDKELDLDTALSDPTIAKVAAEVDQWIEKYIV